MSDDNYKIEKGVPIPHWHENAAGKWSSIARKMEAGDSVLVGSRMEAMNLRNAIVRQGFKCVTRGNDSRQPRVWKLNKETPKNENTEHRNIYPQ
jgi:hypothetical protein